MTDIEQHDSVEVLVGVNVGKGAHHAVALDRKGKRPYSNIVLLRELFTIRITEVSTVLRNIRQSWSGLAFEFRSSGCVRYIQDNSIHPIR